MTIERIIAALSFLGFKKGRPNGVAELDNTGKVPADQLPAASGGDGVPEAPQDGTTYGRKDGAWAGMVDGKDGSTWRSGTVAPAAGVGVNGDYYLNTVSGEVYGPKAAGAWGGVVLTIKGVDGVGAKWIVASGAPAVGTGVNGDVYLDSATSDVYGPKAAGAWGAIALNIKGLQGNPGTSSKWLMGVGAPAAGTGANGDAYLDTANGNVYGPKAAGAWPASSGTIKGIQGDAGVGAKWLTGAGAPAAGTGANTDMYLNSTNGDIYGPKTAGAWGSVVVNLKGVTGTAGSKFLIGTGVPAAGTGVDTDVYLNSATGDIYGPKAAGAWGAIAANIKGIQGNAGVGAKWLLGTATPPAAGTGVDGDMYLNTTTWAVYGPKASGAWPASSGAIKGADGANGTSGAPFAAVNNATTGTVATVLTKVSTLTTYTLTGNTTFSTPTFDTAMTAHLAAGGVVEFIMDYIQGATAYTVTYWSGIDYRTSGGTAPGAPAASKRVEHFVTYSTARGWVLRVGQPT